jgi:hypothetical protein
MANSEFKTAAAQLLDQNGVKESPTAAALQAEPMAQPIMQESKQVISAKKIPINLPFLLSLAKTKLSLGLAVLGGFFMLAVPELLFPYTFKIVNVILGIVIGLTYGIILCFPNREGEQNEHENN